MHRRIYHGVSLGNERSLFIHPLDKCLISIYYVPSTVLGARDRAVSKIHKVSVLMDIIFSQEERSKNQISIICGDKWFEEIRAS